jgi:glycosyltransferase involved in cell wall biosynthesis
MLMSELRVRRDRPTITAVITTFNEEHNIGECIESVLWCDEVVIVDSFSTDRTVEIARSFPGVRVLQREYLGSASQKNWAIRRATGTWVIIFDADERCTVDLRQEIEKLLAAGPRREAYSIYRRVFFMGKVIRFSGWQNDKVVRLFKRGSAYYPNRRVHADMVTRGPAGSLRNRMLHYMIESFDEYLLRIVRYGTWGAAQAWRDGRRSSAFGVFFHPFWRFVRMYLLQLGFLDGARGIVFCILQSYASYLKWAKLWAWQVDARRGRSPRLPAFDQDETIWSFEEEPEGVSG